MSKIKKYSILFILLVTLSNCKKNNAIENHFSREKQPFAFLLPQVAKVPGVPGKGYRAQDCGTCHTQIYQDWKKSTHSKALSDIQFQAELAKKASPKWLCLNCHIPVANQREFLVKSFIDNNILKPILVKNKNFDKSFQQEAVSCASCHIRIQEGTPTILAIRGTGLAPHPVKVAPERLRNVCQRCHDPKGEAVTPNLVCWFETSKEMKLAQENGSLPRSKVCSSCHMPKHQASLVPLFKNLPIRKTPQHFWLGSGIPKRYQDYKNLLIRGYRPAIDFKVKLISDKNILKNILVTVSNKRSGHSFPTGDPERFLLVIVKILNSKGHVLQELRKRIGQTWKWNPARKISDNRLKQNETRVLNFALIKDTNYHSVNITAYHVRVTSHTAQITSKTKNINESLLKDGAYLVKNIKKYYPLANKIYNEDIDIYSGRKIIQPLKKLILESSHEKHKSLQDRAY